MKKFLIVFCSIALITSIAAFAYNSDKGPVKQTDGLTELPQPANDSIINHGKYLISQTNYSEQDLKAIVMYLNNR